MHKKHQQTSWSSSKKYKTQNHAKSAMPSFALKKEQHNMNASFLESLFDNENEHLELLEPRRKVKSSGSPGPAPTSATGPNLSRCRP